MSEDFKQPAKAYAKDFAQCMKAWGIPRSKALQIAREMKSAILQKYGKDDENYEPHGNDDASG